jgi:hypothetical protein
MKKSELVKMIREEVKAVLELTQAEKTARIKAKKAEMDANKIAAKHTQDELNKLNATPVDQN